MTEETISIQKLAEPFHLTLTRNAKGRYQWEISVHTGDVDEAFKSATDLDARLKEQYKGQTTQEEKKE